jgi:hypothetical protein
MSVIIENRANHIILNDHDNDWSLWSDQYAKVIIPKSLIRLWLSKWSNSIIIPMENGKIISLSYDHVSSPVCLSSTELFDIVSWYIES